MMHYPIHRPYRYLTLELSINRYDRNWMEYNCGTACCGYKRNCVDVCNMWKGATMANRKHFLSGVNNIEVVSNSGAEAARQFGHVAFLNLVGDNRWQQFFSLICLSSVAVVNWLWLCKSLWIDRISLCNFTLQFHVHCHMELAFASHQKRPIYYVLSQYWASCLSLIKPVVAD